MSCAYSPRGWNGEDTEIKKPGVKVKTQFLFIYKNIYVYVYILNPPPSPSPNYLFTSTPTSFFKTKAPGPRGEFLRQGWAGAAPKPYIL